MIHQYKSNGYNIVMDINSGAIHVVDDVVYDIIELYEGHEKSEIMDMLASKYPKEDMEEAFEEIETLIKEEVFLQKIFIKIILLILRRERQLSKRYVCISPMTVILPVAIVLQKKASITADVLS